MSELKPCPFCGGAPQLVEQIKVNADIYDKSKWHVLCKSCLCGTFVRDTQKEVITTWNTRALEVKGEI